MLLFQNEGLTEDIRKAFIVYLISRPRLLIELLDPRFKEIHQVFKNEFQGMTFQPVILDDLYNTREKLVAQIRQGLTENERQFILSIKQCNPNWSLLDIEGINNLTAVQWKLQNIEKMEKKKHQLAYEKLKRYLQL